MISYRRTLSALVLGVALLSVTASAQSLAQQWKQGLSGTRLTSYSGSAISSNSTLTVVELCGNGRYRYYKEGSWSVPGQAGGASNDQITGRWDIQQRYGQTILVYVTDRGDRGFFPIYLQNDRRVNIGGTAFSAQQGAASCY
ncbi:MAG: hypothetical protein PVF51_04850 [Nitrospirota bacterium]|jgi:hypothetical protein